MRTTLDQALIRWSVVHREWHELANDMPMLGAFLAGWYWRDMGNVLPKREEIGTHCGAFRKGWAEANVMIEIMEREEKAEGKNSVVKDSLIPQWTEQTPIEPGWYWWRRDEGVESCLMQVWTNRRVLWGIAYTQSRTVGGMGPLAEFKGQWLGPIEPREEGEKEGNGLSGSAGV